MSVQTIVPNLWFDTKAEEAAKYWVDVFSNRIGAESRPKSEIVNVSRYPQDMFDGAKRAGDVLTVDFQLEGQRFTAINGGPNFTFDEAVSFLVNCETQEEIDELWDRLAADGGEPGPCGWIKDKYGLSWQIVPSEMDQLMLAGPDEEGKKRAFAAMMHMGKLDIAELQRAYKGE
jgi:predicted 3-demethylubiquinone-9 3-methyltransferase (glyoxalase superfamily)